MAYVQNNTNNDDNEDQSQNGGNPKDQQGSGVNISGNSATDNSTGGATTSSTASPAPTKSGSFQNVQSYLDANAGFNNGKGLAGKAYDTLKDQQQQQENNINQSSTQFNQDSSAAGSSYDPTKVSSFVQQATADPTSFASDPNNVQQYHNYLGAQYTGPQNLNNAADLQNQAQQYAQTTGLTSSEPGRLALLQKLYNNGSYTQGQQSLDNMLIQGNPDQLAHLQSAQGLGSQVQSDFNIAQNNAQTQAQKYKDWAGQAVNTSGTALTNAATGIDTNLQNTANQAVSDQQNIYNRINGELQSGKISKADIQLLGLTPDQVSNLYGVNATNINGGNPLSQTAAATKESIASQGDVGKLQALANLGGSYLPNVSTIAQQYNNPNVIGSYKGPVQYDTNALLNQINSAKAQYEGQLNPDQTALTNDTSTLQQRQNLLNSYNSIVNGPGINQDFSSLIPQLQSLYGSDTNLNKTLMDTQIGGKNNNELASLLSSGYLSRGIADQSNVRNADQSKLDALNKLYNQNGNQGLEVI